jgi:hypothetical protein
VRDITKISNWRCGSASEGGLPPENKFQFFSLYFSTMTCKKDKSPLNGPSAELISRINHLGHLLKNLPRNLPLDPLQSESRYNFGLETEHVEEEGVWFAFNKNLEACFETHTIPAGGTIVFRERGKRCEALIKMFKEAVKALTKDADRDFLQEVWLERLIKAAELQGAKVPKK